MYLKLQEHRKAAGMTQRDLSKALGKSLGTIQSWESGLSSPNAECVWALCKILGTDPDTILGWDEFVDDKAFAVSHDERLLIEDYRSCTPSRKAAISSMTRDMAGMSKLSKTASRRDERAQAG